MQFNNRSKLLNPCDQREFGNYLKMKPRVTGSAIEPLQVTSVDPEQNLLKASNESEKGEGGDRTEGKGLGG